MAYYVPSTPPIRGRAYSFSQPSQYYPPTPYSAGNALSIPYTPGVARSAPYYVAPTVHSGRRSRSHSRPRHSSHHHRPHHHHSSHHGHTRRSHSVGAHRHQQNRPSAHYPRPHRGTTPLRHHHSPSLGKRILSFFGLGSSHNYVDQYGRSIDSRGRPKYKY